MVGFRHIVSSALVAGLIAGGVTAPAWADSSTVRTFASGELCTTSSDGLVTYNAGAITIDIAKLDLAVTDVMIATGSLSGCLNQITSIGWTGTHPLSTLTVQNSAVAQNNIVNTLTSVSFPSGLQSLQIEDYAFWQQASDTAGSTGPNTLASVTLPDGLKSLTIGNSAFAQFSTLGDNALTSLSLPSTLTDLDIGTYAFYQQAEGSNALTSVQLAGGPTSLTLGPGAFRQYAVNGDNALSSIEFPAGLTSLTLGDQAFAQSAPSGSNALASVKFPATVVTLDIGDQAFLQYSSAVDGLSLKTVRFPGALSSLTIGTEAFRQQGGTSVLAAVILERAAAWTSSPTLAVGTNAFAGGADPTWYWFGADGTSLTDAWSGTISGLSPVPSLLGYRTLSFDDADGAPQRTWYVYPVTRGVGHVDAPQVLERAALGSTWSVSLPTATRDDYELDGWCSSASGLCLPKSVGSSYALASASQTLYARWTVLPPTVASTLADATVGVPYSASVASGAELACSVTAGALPAGLSLSGCTISGTPTTPGSASFTVRAENATGSPAGALTLKVRNAPPVITTSALVAGKVTVPYTAAIGVSGGGAIHCSHTAGALPPGLSLSGCTLTGTPTATGTYAFTVTASNDGGSGSHAITVSISAAKKFTKVYKPKISGKAKVGRTLSASVKTWKPKPTKTTWQWKRNGVAIPGATKSKYKLTKADKGKRITVTAVRARVGYQSSSTSKSTARVK
jgi:hypothetical protein